MGALLTLYPKLGTTFPVIEEMADKLIPELVSIIGKYSGLYPCEQELCVRIFSNDCTYDGEDTYNMEGFIQPMEAMEMCLFCGSTVCPLCFNAINDKCADCK